LLNIPFLFVNILCTLYEYYGVYYAMSLGAIARRNTHMTEEGEEGGIGNLKIS
jgi:hypothetical protein